MNVELIRGRGGRWNPAPPTTPSGHLDDVAFGQQPLGSPSLLHPVFQFFALDVTITVLPGHSVSSAWEAGLSLSLQLVLGAGQLSKLPGPWGIQTREFSRLRPWKPRMRNNPSVTGIRFHHTLVTVFSGSCAQCPTVSRCTFSGLPLGVGKG